MIYNIQKIICKVRNSDDFLDESVNYSLIKGNVDLPYKYQRSNTLAGISGFELSKRANLAHFIVRSCCLYFVGSLRDFERFRKLKKNCKAYTILL